MKYTIIEYRVDYVVIQDNTTMETKTISYDLADLYHRQRLIGD